MKAAVLEEFSEPLVVREVPDPVISDRGALIKVEANGICRSDWHAWKGHWPGLFQLPHVLGHEMAGTVAEIGSTVTRFAVGDRVIVPFSGGDGTCTYCQAGRPNLCDHPVVPGFRSWGAFGEMVAVEHADTNLVPLPDPISFEAAAGMGCRYMTSFHAVTTRAQLKAGDWVVVFGCGGVGLSVIEIAVASGAAVVAVDIDPEKLALAKDLGAAADFDASFSADVTSAIKDLTMGGAHVTFDALGSQVTCVNAIQSLRKGGRHVQIGMSSGPEGGMVALPMDDIVSNEIEILGTQGMPAHAFAPMLQMVATGRLKPDRLVRRTVSVDDAGDVLAAMDRYDTHGFTVINRF